MNTVEHAIMSIGGHPHRSCYRDLCWAIYVEMAQFPKPLQMKFIVAEVCERMNKDSPKTVWRSIARAVEDLWDSGDMEVLCSYCPNWRWYRPKPMEFIFIVALAMRDEALADE